MTPEATPTLDCKVTIPDDVVFREIAGESVLLDLASGEYYGLNEAGTRIWTLLVAGTGPAEVLSSLRREYEADETVLRGDFLGLLGELASRGLVRIDGG